MSPKSAIMPLLCLLLWPFHTLEAAPRCGEVFETSDLRMQKIAEFSVEFDQTSLRLAEKSRLENAKSFSSNLSTAKFSKISDAQLREQWHGDQVSGLYEDSQYPPLAPINGLRRGQFLTLTRNIWISKADFIELLKTKLVVSHNLHSANYDFHELNRVYNQAVTSPSLVELYHANLYMGGTMVSTTYNRHGYFRTRETSPVILDKDKGFYSIQLRFKMPVEALVIVSGEIPKHVLDNPFGFGLAELNRRGEGEVTFVGGIPPEWIETDLNEIHLQFLRGEIPQHSFDLEIRGYPVP